MAKKYIPTDHQAEENLAKWAKTHPNDYIPHESPANITKSPFLSFMIWVGVDGTRQFWFETVVGVLFVGIMTLLVGEGVITETKIYFSTLTWRITIALVIFPVLGLAIMIAAFCRYRQRYSSSK